MKFWNKIGRTEKWYLKNRTTEIKTRSAWRKKEQTTEFDKIEIEDKTTEKQELFKKKVIKTNFVWKQIYILGLK